MYILSNQLYLDGLVETAAHVYYLNRIMNSVNWFYEIALPEHFSCTHPIRSVLGRANYCDYLSIFQTVTIGANYKEGVPVHPTLGDYVTLYANATVLGNSRIGYHVVISASTFIIDTDVPDCSVVFGNRAGLTIKRYTEEEMVHRYFSGWK